MLQHQTDAIKAGLAAHAAVEASNHLAAAISRELRHMITRMHSEGRIAEADATALWQGIRGDMVHLNRALLYADTATLGTVDSQARAARVDQVRARTRTARVLLKIKTDEKDSQLLQAVKTLPAIPASQFGGRLFNAIEGLVSEEQRAQAATALVDGLGRGYRLKLELDKKNQASKRPFHAGGTSGGPPNKKQKGYGHQNSGNQNSGNGGGRHQPAAGSGASRGQQHPANSSNASEGN